LDIASFHQCFFFHLFFKSKIWRTLTTAKLVQFTLEEQKNPKKKKKNSKFSQFLCQKMAKEISPEKNNHV
jgi:hypothetical protein